MAENKIENNHLKHRNENLGDKTMILINKTCIRTNIITNIFILVTKLLNIT